jgi:hypothetical protein
MKVATVALLSAATATGAGQSHEPNGNGKRTFQATGLTGSGAGSTSVDIEVSNDGVTYIVMGTISLTLSTTETTDGFASDATWRYVRANIKSISGTGASVTVTMGNSL